MSVANPSATPAVEQPVSHTGHRLIEQWLVQLNSALQSASASSIACLFAAQSHWRDLLAFTWSITPCQGADAIAALMLSRQARHRAVSSAPGRCD